METEINTLITKIYKIWIILLNLYINSLLVELNAILLKNPGIKLTKNGKTKLKEKLMKVFLMR